MKRCQSRCLRSILLALSLFSLFAAPALSQTGIPWSRRAGC